MTAMPADGFLAKRKWMVESQLRSRGVRDERVLNVMLQVPRHAFAPPEKSAIAYEDQPLEIGERQTISQPYITAVMLQALAFNGTERCLEVGTGSGYATALVSLLAAQVYTIERHESLLDSARERLTAIGYSKNLVFLLGDG